MKGSVRFENVTKKFGEVVALKPLSLDIAPGTLVTLLGPSGCGKTTTLRLIAGLESASEGRILIGGQDVTHLSATYRKVSMVFQSYALFPHMTVLENVGYGLTVSGVRKAEVQARAEAGLETVGLKGFGARLPSELSGGQQQRVAVARAIGFRGASNSAWRWRAPSFLNRKCCFWTNRSRTSMPNSAAMCARKSARSSNALA